MKEVLYVVNVRRSSRGLRVTVIATLTKEADTYTYTPYNLEVDAFPRAKEAVTMKQMPSIAQRRLYSRRRPDIQALLAKYGLTHYDEWELLKRTNGRLPTDNILYLTREELEILKRNPSVISFVGVDEEAATSARPWRY